MAHITPSSLDCRSAAIMEETLPSPGSSKGSATPLAIRETSESFCSLPETVPRFSFSSMQSEGPRDPLDDDLSVASDESGISWSARIEEDFDADKPIYVEVTARPALHLPTVGRCNVMSPHVSLGHSLANIVAPSGMDADNGPPSNESGVSWAARDSDDAADQALVTSYVDHYVTAYIRRLRV